MANHTTAASTAGAGSSAVALSCSLVVALVPLSCVLLHRVSELFRQPSRTSCSAGLSERLCDARKIEHRLRTQVTFSSLAVAWAAFILGIPMCYIVRFVGGMHAMDVIISREPLPVLGLLTVLPPTLVLLACRPLDHVGVRLAGAFCAITHFYYVAHDVAACQYTASRCYSLDQPICLDSMWVGAAVSGWEASKLAPLLLLGLLDKAALVAGGAVYVTVIVRSASTRDALSRLFVTLRVVFLVSFVSSSGQWLWLLSHQTARFGTSHIHDCGWSHFVRKSFGSGFGLLFAVFLTRFACERIEGAEQAPLTAPVDNRRVRGRIHRCLGWNWLRASSRSMAAVASLVGSGAIETDQRCRKAIDTFRAMPWAGLTEADLLLGQAPEDNRSVPARLGEVDAFISHSWADAGAEKYEVLREWAGGFEAEHGRPPLLWLDRCCIRQDAVAASLLQLPIYLSGCRSLLVLHGPTYCSRLWCVLEIFIFVAMGGAPGQVEVLPLRGLGGGRAQCGLGGGLARFRLSEASCSLPSDRTRMLAVIECSFGDEVPFNQMVQTLLRRKIGAASGSSAV